MLKVTCAVIIKNGRILITQNGENSDHPYLWEFPGGKVNEGEPPEVCIKREIMEELAIEIDILQKMFSVMHDYGFKKIELIPFLCSIRSGDIVLNEHHNLQWIDNYELEKIPFSEADRIMIELNKNRDILKKYLGEHMNNAG